MSTFVEFLKARWKPLAILAGAVAVVPVSMYFSSSWRSSIIDSFAKTAQTDEGDIKKAKVEYDIAPVLPGGERYALNAYPNEVITEFYKAQRAKQAGAATEMYSLALQVNKVAHVESDGKPSVLVKGLFPDPIATESEIKRDAMLRAYLAYPAKLVTRARAGGPPDSLQLAKDVADQRVSIIKSMTPVGRETAQISAAQAEEVRVLLTKFRFERLSRQAASYSFYADPGSFRLYTIADGTQPTMAQCYDWQQVTWFQDDVVAAITKVNAQAASGGGVAQAVVKRLESMIVDPAKLGSGEAPADPNAGTPRVGPEVPPPGDSIPKDYSRSITGRICGPGSNNNFYDLRTATVTVVVSAKGLPLFINALAQTNYMSVLSVRMEAVDSMEDLKKGYYYGDEAVVRATLVVESVWLRDWTKEIMPKSVRAELGVPDPAPAPGADGTPPAAAGGAG